MDGVSTGSRRPGHGDAFDLARRTTNTRNTTVNSALASKDISMTPNTLFPMVIKNGLLTGLRTNIGVPNIGHMPVNLVVVLIISDEFNLPIRASIKIGFGNDG